MKTALYVGINGNTDFVNSAYDRIVCTDSRLFTNVTENILDNFLKTMRSKGFRIKLTHISYDRPFYVKCYNEKQFIKYYFNTSFPVGSLLKYEKIDTIILGTDYRSYPSAYIQDLIRTIRQYIDDDYCIMQTSYQHYLQ
jgi:hypothetical protein